MCLYCVGYETNETAIGLGSACGVAQRCQHNRTATYDRRRSLPAQHVCCGIKCTLHKAHSLNKADRMSSYNIKINEVVHAFLLPLHFDGVGWPLLLRGAYHINTYPTDFRKNCKESVDTTDAFTEWHFHSGTTSPPYISRVFGHFLRRMRKCAVQPSPAAKDYSLRHFIVVCLLAAVAASHLHCCVARRRCRRQSK